MSAVAHATETIRQALLAAFTLLALAPVGRADDDDLQLPPPPVQFNGAVGRFSVKATADPQQVQAEDPITYTVRITATELVRPPKRPALSEFPDFTDDFYLEDVAPREGRHPDEKTWEFAYRLKPKTTTVASIPTFPFIFYRPGAKYEQIYTPEIEITVTPRKRVGPGTTAPRPIAAPEAAFSLADGDALHREGDRLPGSLVIALALVGPPIGCVAWYFLWRRLYPDDARRARRRRSRAAQEALRALRAISKQSDAEKQARSAAAVVARYLHQRLECPVVEPTPAEVESYLRTQGVSEQVSDLTADLMRECTIVCFDPERPSHADLAAAVSEVILALEAETWSE